MLRRLNPHSRSRLDNAVGFGFSPATVTAYNPSLRDKAAMKLQDLLGSGPVATHFIDGLMGGTGLGHQHTGLVDWVPGIGQALQADEGGDQIANGHPVAGIVNTALAAMPFPAVAKGFGFAGKKVAQAVERAVTKTTASTAERAVAPIIAYHGSPYKFDAFDPSFIGDGEGAQAYGHGLYFAENEKVAQGYRDKLAPGKLVSPDDLAEYYSPGRIVDGYAGKDRVVRFNPGSSENPWGWSVDVQSVKPDGAPIPGSYVRNHATQPDPAKMEAVLGRTLPRGGAMYQVGINAPPEHFLDWDAPLNAQSPKVQQALSDAGVGGLRFAEDGGHQASSYSTLHPIIGPRGDQAGVVGEMDGRFNLYQHGEDKGGFPTKEAALEHVAENYGPIPGAAAYRGLINKQGDAAAAAKTLSDAGIPGIKYFDGGSRGSGNGTRNYVVFSPENIDILKRYGLPAALGLGAAGAVAATPDQAQAAPALPPPNNQFQPAITPR